MLTITIPAAESFDEATNTFISSDEVTLHLEHSLVSLSKWESIYEKPFLGDESKSDDEVLGYVRAMSKVDHPPEVFQRLSNDHVNQINSYIEAKMSATWFSERPAAPGKAPAPNRKVVTSELLYYWMFSLSIPLECENWHLSRLFTLIKVFNQENAPKEKMGKKDLASRNQMLNAQRKAKLKTSG